MQSQKQQMISVRFQGKPFKITVIQVYAPTSNAEEAEVEWFYEDLQDLLDQIRSDQISRSVVSDLKTQPPLTNAFPPISHYFSFLPAPFHPIPLSFLSFLSCCSSFSDAPVIANTGQKPLRAMV